MFNNIKQLIPLQHKTTKIIIYVLYNYNGETMKIYVDLIIFLNFMFDFILLLVTNIILKRGTSLKRIILGALVGSLTIVVLFIPFTTCTLFFLKVLLSILIILITFGYKDLKYFLINLFYFYIVSIILGGFMYYLNIEFSYKNIGMVFYHKGLSINYIFIIIFSPIILLMYKRQMKLIKEINSLHYNVEVYVNDKPLYLKGFMDTGNTLVDPITKRKVIITNSREFINIVKNNMYYLVPYETVSSSNLIKCYKVDKIYIKELGIRKDILVGITKEKLKYNGINCILNYYLMEGK